MKKVGREPGYDIYELATLINSNGVLPRSASHYKLHKVSKKTLDVILDRVTLYVDEIVDKMQEYKD